MTTITLTISKSEVYEEVDKTTSYTGVKIDEATVPAQKDEAEAVSAYKRIRASEHDQAMLDRFFAEAANMATNRMKDFITSVQMTTGYNVSLSLSSRWDSSLQPSMQSSLYSYFVSFILARWFKLANKDEADTYMADANAMLDDVMRKIYYRSKPVRVTPS